MDDDIAIKVDHIDKTFKLPHEKNNSLKSSIVSFYKHKKGYEKQQALKDISFEIKKGEFFGIVGRNGSGKSTLLKILAGIYNSDKGSATINGKLVPFIELGVGFSPELTGRDNVFLNGALLGFSRNEMKAMYDDIVEFAEIERFMDQKLKNYSSGMQVRLAFSIAIRARSDILLFDEVLAVGDENFQKKCLNIFSEYKKNKKTIILVSHSTGDIEKFCDRVLVLDQGKKIGIFDARKATSLYKEINFDSEKQPKNTGLPNENIIKNRWGTKNLSIKSISTGKTKIMSGKPLRITINIGAKKASSEERPILVGLAFYDDMGINISGPNSSIVHMKFPPNKESMRVVYEIDKNPLNEGKYRLTVAIFDEFQSETYDYWQDAITLRISSDQAYNGKVVFDGKWQQG